MALSENSTTATETYKTSGDIQILLSKSYSLFFFGFVFGLILDVVTRLRINIINLDQIGLILIVLSSMLIYWAQSVNKTPKYLADGKRNFAYGPYAFSRHPTYLGLFLLMIGAALVMNSYSILATSIVSFVISIFTFMDKEEKRHIKKYGELYLEYMKRVRRVI